MHVWEYIVYIYEHFSQRYKVAVFTAVFIQHESKITILLVHAVQSSKTFSFSPSTLFLLHPFLKLFCVVHVDVAVSVSFSVAAAAVVATVLPIRLYITLVNGTLMKCIYNQIYFFLLVILFYFLQYHFVLFSIFFSLSQVAQLVMG